MQSDPYCTISDHEIIAAARRGRSVEAPSGLITSGKLFAKRRPSSSGI